MREVSKILLLTILFSYSLSAYDRELAKSIDRVFSQYSLKHLNSSKMLITADNLMKMIKNQESFLLLDIRTEEEIAILSLNIKDRLEIPLDRLFREENLNRLPSTKPIIILCHSGSRATQALTSLEILGFRDVKVLYGGVVALAKSDSTKNL